jgi:hypothetical protein
MSIGTGRYFNFYGNIYVVRCLMYSIMSGSGFRSKRRFAYDVCFRCTSEQREFLEKYAWENGVGLAEVGRACIDLLMEKEGATS